MREENSPKVAHRMRDITSWREGDISALSSREKKRYNKRKSAVEAYFTTKAPIDEIAQRHHLSSEVLCKLANFCVMLHEDATPWGFRALLPGVKVIDHTPQALAEEQAMPAENVGDVRDVGEDGAQTEHAATDRSDSSSSAVTELEQHSLLVEEAADETETDTAKRQAIKLSNLTPVLNIDVPETPAPTYEADEEDEAVSVSAEEHERAEEHELPLEVEQEGMGEEEVTREEVPTSKLEELPPAQPLTVTEEEIVEADTSSEAVAEAPTSKLTELGGEEPPAIVEPETPPGEPEPPPIGEGVAHESGDVEEPMISTEAERAIAEAERILVEHKDPLCEDDDDDDGNAETVKLNPEAVRARAGARVTTPIRAVTTKVLPVVLPASPREHTYASARKTVQGRLVRKRWQRDTHGQHKQKRSVKIMTIAALAAMLLFVVMPIGAGLAAYGAYNNISAIAHDGINHLLTVKSIFSVAKSDPTAALTAPKLEQAQVEFRAAERDFMQLQQLANRPDVQGVINQFAPQYGSKLGMLQSLVQVAVDVSRMGDELSGVALIGANIIHGSPLAATSTKPLLSVSDVEAIEGSMVHALYYISDIRAQMSHISVKDLPISDAQKAQLVALLPLLPKAEQYITQAQSLIGIVSWLLGVGHPRHFLIQTMDRAELRPGGGFTGQYGILQIEDGRITPPSLTDVTLIDYAENGTAIGRSAPPEYKWMNFGNWGVRDSNLSGDFPTTAQMTMKLFQDEGGGPVDGDIAFTPVVIANILDVIGPIKVPGYNETITSKNLEERLHYYQQDFSAIAREKQISGNYSHTGRKAFTSTLAKLLLDRVRHLPVKQLLEVMKSAVKSIQSRDLEIYFSNPDAEQWLVQHGYSASIDTFSKQDGFIVVQANISISKASQYVHTTEHDDVTLDAQGGAIHNLTITLDYQQKGPVYGYDTYADYIRVYAPAGSQLQGGDGFDTGQLLCRPGTVGTPVPGATGAPISGCGQYNGYFPSNARYCPDGNYSLGIRGGGGAWPIDSLGPPTSQSSDLPGRAMWGGLTLTPKNCISTISVSWYVPHAVRKVNGQLTYSILIQKQSGYSPTIELNIDASAIKGLKSFKFSGDINTDRLFTLASSSAKK